MNKKQRLVIFITSIAIVALIQVVVIGLIRNLGGLISLLGPLFDLSAKDVKQFSAIFAQLANARLAPPIMPIILFYFCFQWLLRSIHNSKQNTVRVILSCFFGVFLFPVAVVTVFLFTNVNGIRFANVLASLLQVLSAGAF